jgi:hypothetical protein
MLSELNTRKINEKSSQDKIDKNHQESKDTPHMLQEIYTKSEVLHLFQKLSNRIDDLEHTVSILKKKNKGMQGSIPTKKEILEQLNDYDNGATPTVDFNDMIKLIQTDITIPHELLEDRTLKLDDLVISMLEALHKYLDTEHKKDENANIAMPIVNFQDYHKNVMFVYTNCTTEIKNNIITSEYSKNTLQWTILTNEHLQKIIQNVHVSLIKQCNQWRENFIEETMVKHSSQNKEILSNKYIAMIARICHTSPHTNHSMLQKIKKVWSELVSEETIFRLHI